MLNEKDKFVKKLNILNELVVKEDFLTAFKSLMSFFKQAVENLNKRYNDTLRKVESMFYERADSLTAKVDKKLGEVKDGIDGKDGERGEDGITPDTTQVVDEAATIAKEAVLPLIPNIEQFTDKLPQEGEKIRDGLELLQGDSRLEIKSIKDLREELDELKKIRGRSFGGGGYSKIAADQHELNWTVIGTGDGTTAEFTLNTKPDPIESLEIMVGGGPAFSTDDYTYDSSTGKITFLTNSIPNNGAKIRQKCKR